MTLLRQLLIGPVVKRYNNEIPKHFSENVSRRIQPLQPSSPSIIKEPCNKSFVLNLFRGDLVEKQVFPFPEPLNTSQIQTTNTLILPVQKFFKEVNDPFKNDVDGVVKEFVMKHLWDLGLFGCQVPTFLGGLGLNNSQYAHVVQTIGESDLGISIILGAHQCIGFKGILMYGTPEQKLQYLPKVCSGQFAAFCLSETCSGADTNAITTRAELSPDKSHYILNGSKSWISNGGISEVMTVFAKTPFNNTTNEKPRDKITAFIVERAFGGVTSGPSEKKMGINACNITEVHFENVMVPVENVLGKHGQGLQIANGVLNSSRLGTIAALCGAMRSCIAKAVEHTKSTQQFGRCINAFETIQDKLSHMAMYHYVTESMTYALSANMDSGSQFYQLEAAISKCFASEAAWYVCDEAIQILGGTGYLKETGLERVLRDIRIFRIFDGANEILRLLVALSGVQYAGNHLREHKRDRNKPTIDISLLFEEPPKRIIKACELGALPPLGTLVHNDLKMSSVLAAKCMAKFGVTVETALYEHGKSLIQRQIILNKIADAATDIYAMAVVLSRASQSLNKQLPTSEYESVLAQCWCLEAYHRITANLSQIKTKTPNFKKYTRISEMLCRSGGVVQ